MARPRYFPNEDTDENVHVPTHHAGGQREPWRPDPCNPVKPSQAVRQRLAEQRAQLVEQIGRTRIAWAGKGLLA